MKIYENFKLYQTQFISNIKKIINNVILFFQKMFYKIGFNFNYTFILYWILLACLLLLFSCKTTTSTIVDKSEIRDSTSVVTEVRKDSSIINQDTEKITETTEKEITKDNTTITFGDGGGTFNVNTGEATNVTSVITDKQSEKLKQDIANLQIKYTEASGELQLLRDSIKHINNNMNIETEIEETYQASWYWWLAIGALLMLVLIVVLRKIPQTSWLLFWI
jgi:hypothetical protein